MLKKNRPGARYTARQSEQLAKAAPFRDRLTSNQVGLWISGKSIALARKLLICGMGFKPATAELIIIQTCMPTVDYITADLWAIGEVVREVRHNE